MTTSKEQSRKFTYAVLDRNLPYAMFWLAEKGTIKQ